MLSIIVAIGKNNELGSKNQMLWHLPNDLKRFKKITIGHTIIMGRKTFNSLPKLLPDREHIIITRDRFYKLDDNHSSFDGKLTIVHSIEEVFELLNDEEENFVIGGGEIYRQFLPYTEKLYLTTIDRKFKADTFFPEIDYEEWEVIEEVPGIIDDKNLLPHKFITLKRRINQREN